MLVRIKTDVYMEAGDIVGLRAAPDHCYIMDYKTGAGEVCGSGEMDKGDTIIKLAGRIRDSQIAMLG
ncbi:MAG: hypothetical protein GY807_10770 [Gammaproteobacteria bacterium]|nr:hypothetical protein [Gammaproteobacteria bacterium]